MQKQNKPKFTRVVRTSINQKAKGILANSEKLKRVNPNLYRQMKIKVQDELIKKIARVTGRNSPITKTNVVQAAKIVRQKHVQTMNLYKKLLNSGSTMSAIFRRITDATEKPTAEDLQEIANFGFKYITHRLEVWDMLKAWTDGNSIKNAAVPYVMDAFNEYLKSKGINTTQKERVEILRKLLSHLPDDISWDVTSIEGITEIKLAVDNTMDQILGW